MIEYPDSDIAKLRNLCRGLKVGESFVWSKNNKHPYAAAKKVGIKVSTRKEDQVGWRITRVA